MLGNISDAAIIILVAILLLAGQKDVGGTIRNLGKTLEEMKKKQEDFRQEFMRELNETGEVSNSIKKDLSDAPIIKPYHQQTNDHKIEQLEDEIKRLQSELERLKNSDRKN
ncbi:twin-arginine translocase TatA/TatE family subunit [Acidianus sp. HS-5]|uniref:twin-arginine translocase TatA/TatE family subunit n=1 Tax=Acidianus sp. HS-5 TaxID=2886040 RepID=UPI001F001A52|nr:twin-arginine translocase TatA/TatE family subunit [Acidianus sp. HS-5]BDC17282.1 hypothetical protein HS5_01720 [Acidianus sp. HS-5]